MERADKYLAERFGSREKAAAALKEGVALINGRRAKPSDRVSDADVIEILPYERHVGRGALKLEGAFAAFPLNVEGRVCLDAGASTGGFTEVLLAHGAKKVYAVDVGEGQLAAALAGDNRVVNLEKTDIRGLAELPERPEFFTADLSFISLKLVLPAILRLCAPEGIVLIKPQFEYGRYPGKTGVLKDRRAHAEILKDLAVFFSACGAGIAGIAESPVTGGEGNREYTAYLKAGAPAPDMDGLERLAKGERRA